MLTRAPRPARALLLCLCLGAITTALIAWCAAIYAQLYPVPVPRQKYLLSDGARSWEVTLIPSPARLTVSYEELPPPGSNIAVIRNQGDPDPIPLDHEPSWAAATRHANPTLALVRAYGWPLRSLKSFVTFPSDGGSSIDHGTLATPIHTRTGSAVRLPTIPIPLGFLTNIAILGAGWLALIAGIPALRRALRRRRGHCPSCGYVLSTLPPSQPCPECGHAAA